MSLRLGTALDHTLLIVNDVPGVDETSELHLTTHYGMPLPEAMRRLYALTGVASQAFVFAHTYFSQKDGGTTGADIFDDHVEEMLQRAFGSNPPSVFVELGWQRRLVENVHHATHPGIYGYEHTLVDDKPVAPPLINIFSEFHWNDFYDLIGARTSPTFRYEEHDITDAQLLRGVVRVLRTQLGLFRFNKTIEGVPPNIETLLRNATFQSKYYQHIALVEWEGVQPVIRTIVDVDQYTGPTPCECGDFNCEDYPICVTPL